MLKMDGWVRYAAKVAVVFVLALALIPAIALADDVVQGFAATGALKTGEIVSLNSTRSNTVRAAPANQSQLMFGVVVDASKAPVTISSGGHQTYVAATGNYPVLVSTQNGPIKSGDWISISNTTGIGAKATADQPYVVARAKASFDGTQNVTEHAGKYPVTDLAASLDVIQSPLFKNTLAIPQPLQRIGNSIANREVPPFRVYVALILFIVAVSLAVLLLVIGIRSALISIGRNPLSRHLIMRGLSEVIITAILIFVASLIGVILILRL